MAEINLLQNSNTQGAERKVQSSLNTVGVVLLALVLGAYATFFVLAKQQTDKAVAFAVDQSAIQETIRTDAGYPVLIDSQTKIQALTSLLDKHTGWCALLPQFSKNTVKTAKFAKFNANADGSSTISGTVPDFQELDKLILALQESPGQFIKEVKLVNVGLSSGEKNEITYTMNIIFNNDIFSKYSNSCSS